MEKTKYDFRHVKFSAEIRETDKGEKKKVIRGYPILFNQPTKVMMCVRWEWVEVTETILPTALDGIDLSDIYLFVGHNPDNVLGRAGVNMRLEIDETGLFMECEMPNTQYATDWYTLIADGIVDGMSFGFDCSDPVNPDTLTRTITHFNDLFEVTITPFPAYKQTVVMATDGENQKSEETQRSKKTQIAIDEILKNWR